MYIEKGVLEMILGFSIEQSGIDDDAIRDAGYKISFFQNMEMRDNWKCVVVEKDDNTIVEYKQNTTSTKTDSIVNYVTDKDAFVSLQVMIMQELSGQYLCKKCYDSPSDLIRNCKWRQRFTTNDIINNGFSLVLFDEVNNNNDDIIIVVPWYVVAAITSLGRSITEYMPLQHFDHVCIMDSEYKVITGNPIDNNLDFYIVLDNDNNVVLTVYHHIVSSTIDMQVFDEDDFWCLYEDIIKSIQF